MKILLTLVFVALAYINYRHLNIGFLSLYSIDEYAFHGSLINMYDGLTTLDIKKLFSFGFYSYGFGFFFLNLLATVPFFATDNIEMTIYIPRILTSLFAVGSAWFVYKIAREYTDKYFSILIVLIVLTMPGFWRNSLWFHPDWMMVFFITLSTYLFTKDNFEYKKYFWWALFALGIAISVKVQAITFLPFVFLYLFYDNFQYKNFEQITYKIKLSLKSFFSLFAIFVITNPYLIHPKGLKAFIAMFIENMKSNATNHGKIGVVSISDKINNAIDFYYLDTILFLTIMLLSIIVLFSIFKKDHKKSILPLVSLYIISNIVYLFLMVNKDWQHYYLAIFVLAPLLFVYFVNSFDKYKYIIMIGVLLIQLSTHIYQYQNVLTIGYHPKNEISFEKKLDMSNSLTNLLKPYIEKTTNILISSYQPFNFRSIGLKYKNIYVIYGPLAKNSINLDAFIEKSNSKDPSKFKKKQFVILSKKDIYFDENKLSKMIDKEGYRKAIEIIENFNNSGDLGYEKFTENKYYYIWRKKK